MPHRLDEDESAVEQQRRYGHEHQLAVGIDRSRNGRGEVRQDQRQHRHRPQYRERRTDAALDEFLFVVTGAPGQQAQPDDAVENDHDRREHGIACERRALRTLG